MPHSLEPGDVYSGFPEKYYFHDSLRNGFLNSLVDTSDEALKTYRDFRSKSRRSESTVVYRCDQSNGCLLLEIVPTGRNEYILYLPKFHVSRGEAERMGSALRVYWERAQRLSVSDGPPLTDRRILHFEGLTPLYEVSEDEQSELCDVELVCRHYILDVAGFSLLQDVREGKIRRFLPGTDPCTQRFFVGILQNRWDQPDYTGLREARTRYAKDELQPP